MKLHLFSRWRDSDVMDLSAYEIAAFDHPDVRE